MLRTPKTGDWVLYTMSEQDCDQVRKRRQEGASTGNAALPGETYPMLICRTWGNTSASSVNGQVFLDGDDTLWVTSVAQEGTVPGNDSPERMFRYP